MLNRKTILLYIMCVLGMYAYTVNTPLVITDAPYTFELQNLDKWHDLENQIVSTRRHEIYINWTGFGGSVDMMVEFTSALDVALAQGKEITFIVHGVTASAHAMAVCHSTHTYLTPGAYLLYHHAFQMDMLGTKDYDLGPGGNNEMTVINSTCLRNGYLTITDIAMIDLHMSVIKMKTIDGRILTVYTLKDG